MSEARRRERRRRIGAAGIAVAAVASSLLAPTVVLAAPASSGGPVASTADPAGRPLIQLATQDAWTPAGGDVHLSLDIGGAPAGATVNFTAYQAITARETYDEVMNAGALGSVLSLVSVPVDALPLGADGARTAVVGLQSPTDALDRSRLNLRRPGVYPVDVDLRDANDQTLSTFRTAFVVSEADGRPVVNEPLNVVWVWPLVAEPSYLPNGETDPEVLADLRPEGRLGRQASVLRSIPDVPVTLAPGPETLEAWTALGRDDTTIGAGAEAIKDASLTRQVLGAPYVPVDLPSLLDHGLGSAVDEELARGDEVLATTLGAVADERTRLVTPVTESALVRLRTSGADRFVIEGSSLVEIGNPLTPANPVALQAPIQLADNQPVHALATDVGLEGFLTANRPAALAAQLVLAGLALTATEAPSLPRVVTLANPVDFDAPTAFYTAMLTGLRDNPYLRPVSAAQAFDLVPSETSSTGEPVVRDLVATPSAEPLVSASAYRDQRTRLNAFGALTRPGDPAVGEADRSLLASVSSAWPLDAGRARAARHLATVDRVVNEFLSLIEVPNPKTITLTSRSGDIPLTFRNETGAPVRLRAALSSDKLFFPHGAVMEIELPPKSSTVRVAVETRTSGTFPLTLEVTSIDGVLPISQRRLEVRSTFVSTVGIVLMGSAVLFLAVWWVLDRRRRRRHRAHASAS